MKSHLLKMLGFAVTVLELVLVVLIVDEICWLVPYSLTRYGDSEIRSKCAEVKVGMSPVEAIRVLHRHYTPEMEWKVRTHATEVNELRFSSAAGICVIRLDDTTGSVATVQFDDRWGPVQ